MPNRKLPIKPGDKFGKLEVLSLKGKTLDGRVAWNCCCECGGYAVVCSSHLTRENGKGTKSCGCLRNYKARKLSLDAYFLQRLLAFYTRAAKKRSLNWDISREDFIGLLRENCFYCKSSPSNTLIRQGEKVLYSGINRLDNTKGYTEENVVSCCGTCNRMKSNMSKSRFLAHTLKIARNHG